MLGSGPFHHILFEGGLLVSILAIADYLRPEFREIAMMEEVGKPLGPQHVNALVGLLYSDEVAKWLPGSREPQRMMFVADMKTIKRAFEEVSEELRKDNFPPELVRTAMDGVLVEWEARYPIVLSNPSDSSHLEGTLQATAAAVAWLASTRGAEPVKEARNMAQRARQVLLSGGQEGTARSMQEGTMCFWQRVVRFLPETE